MNIIDLERDSKNIKIIVKFNIKKDNKKLHTFYIEFKNKDNYSKGVFKNESDFKKLVEEKNHKIAKKFNAYAKLTYSQKLDNNTITEKSFSSANVMLKGAGIEEIFKH
ncbi:hypothetical protein HGG64_02375 [Mycoplasma phocoeninasale]|uniref:Uncharacterized protein n=1 Tax=Mycoplasma phocoeninasale TaxID=2726117 RepID=A0A858U5J8_9MOLU|nr:hypothetical protein [Mycoplasma phocoeninasale]QJG66535.1 hypothetical protein HGG64_02375 [Mycoplasma phocoeninasale]